MEVYIPRTTRTDVIGRLQNSFASMLESLNFHMGSVRYVVLRISLTDDAVNFIVEDTGKGISEADSEQLFKFFTKVDDLSEGLGLGLPLAKRHAQNLGGDIIFDPTYHDGCRFVLNILR